MSTKSKTGAKLVDSVRKSKTGSVASKTSESQKAKETATKPKAATSKPKPAAKATTKQAVKNLYSYGRRVWPD